MRAPAAPTAVMNAGRDRPYALDLTACVEFWKPDPGKYELTSGKVSLLKGWKGVCDAAQSGSASLRPTLTTVSGQPELTFSGAQRLALSSTLLSSGTGWSMYAVASYSDLSAGRCVLWPSGGGLAGMAANAAGDGKRTIYVISVGSVTDAAATNATELTYVSRDATTWVMQVNGAGQTLSAPTAGVTAPSGTGFIGSLSTSFPHYGGWREGAVFNAVLTAGQLTALVSDVKRRHGIS